MGRKILVVAVVVGLVGAGGFSRAGDSETVKEVKQAILEGNAFALENNKGRPGEYSRHGALEFWSSGGLMQEQLPEAGLGSWDSFNIDIKHIEVIELVPGQAAVAMYYSEGSMHPKGAAPVPHYFTRVTQVFVKEDGEWKIRASHWSPVSGGSGTSQTAVEE